LAGVSGDEEALSAPHITIRKRLPWLLGIMGLYIGAASAIAPFQSVIAAVPVLAVIMPIFSNTGGTVGIQALTVTIRSLGVGDVTPEDTWKILRKELLAGLGTALALGMTMIALSLIWAKPQEKWVALIAGAVMATNTMVAVTLGTLLPMALKRWKLDPALMSGPLVTTMLDTIGFLTFLSMVSMALNVFHLQS
jgi:magnesium transporter